MKSTAILLLAALSLHLNPGPEAVGQSVTLVFTNGIVRTLESNAPVAEAIAIAGERIVALGSNSSVQPLITPGCRVINLNRRLLLPGFNDAHVHFLSGGFQLASVDLRSANSREEFVERLRLYAAQLPAGEWITGGDWDHERWPGAPLPTREWIDAATPKNPVWISRLDGHMGLANSLALKIAGVTRTTPTPPGGFIVHDPSSGDPSGILKDAAQSLVSRQVPAAALDQKLQAARAATAHAASVGVTSVQDMSGGSDLAVFQELIRRHELKTRVYAVAPLPAWERTAAVGVQAPFGNVSLRIGGLKGFADGSLGSSTALFFDAYHGAPGQFGLFADEMIPVSTMFDRVRAADRAGLQVMVHAIGDRANFEVLNLFERVRAENPPRDRRFRIEHAQHLRPQEVLRFSRLGVIASMQPYHAADDGRWAEKRVGPTRVPQAYVFRALLDAGAQLAFGSDWNVAPLDPVQGIAAAVTRQTLDGKNPNGWVPEQKISVEEAVRAYTAGSAFAEYQELVKGTLKPGKLADLIVLDRDIFTCAPADISSAKVMHTIVGGEIVYSAK
jgi:predicted amidohydrolase YtcJ